MAVSSGQRQLDTLAAAGLALASAGSLAEGLRIVTEAAAQALHADVVIARAARGGEDTAEALAVAARSEALAAELLGSRLRLTELPQHEEARLERAPRAVRRAAERASASALVLQPVHVEGRVRGSLEVMRSGDAFDDTERRLARLASAQISLAVRAFAGTSEADGQDTDALLALAGEALAAGADSARTAG